VQKVLCATLLRSAVKDCRKNSNKSRCKHPLCMQMAAAADPLSHSLPNNFSNCLVAVSVNGRDVIVERAFPEFILYRV
jgi:hypothetical protein